MIVYIKQKEISRSVLNHTFELTSAGQTVIAFHPLLRLSFQSEKSLSPWALEQGHQNNHVTRRPLLFHFSCFVLKEKNTYHNTALIYFLLFLLSEDRREELPTLNEKVRTKKRTVLSIEDCLRYGLGGLHLRVLLRSKLSCCYAFPS